MAVQRQNTQLSLSNPGVGEIKVERSSGGSFAQGLLAAADAATKGVQSYQANKVADDQVVQTNRALKGLMPSEDATMGGARANSMVYAQNQMNSTTMQLKEDARTWTGTDEEWDLHVAESRNNVETELHGKYPGLANDKASRKMVTNMMMEQQPNIQATKMGYDLERQHTDRQNNFTDMLVNNIAGKVGSDVTRGVQSALEAGKAMKLTDAEMHEILFKQAGSRGQTGDDSLLMSTQGIKDKNGVSLYDQNPQLVSQAVQARAVAASHNVIEVGDDVKGIEDRYMAGGSLEELQGSISNANIKYGYSAFSEGQYRALLERRTKAEAKVGKNKDFTSNFLSGNFVGIDGFTQEEVTAGVKDLHSQTDLAVTSYGASNGWDAETVATKKASANAQLSVQLAQAGIQDPEMVRRLKSMQNISPDAIKDLSKEPGEWSDTMRIWGSLPDDQKRNIVGVEGAKYLDDYERFRSLGQNPGAAIDSAGKAQRHGPLSSQERKDVSAASADAAQGVYDKPWYSSESDFPDYAQQQVKNASTDLVTTYIQAGYNKDQATEMAKQDLANNYTYVNGSFIKGNQQMIAQKMNINPQDLGVVTQAYIDIHKQELSDKYSSHDASQLYLDVDAERGVFKVRAGSGGELIQGARPLNELGDYKVLDKWKAMHPDTSEVDFGDRVRNALMPEAKSSATQPGYATGEMQKNQTFDNYLIQNENPRRQGFDKKAGVFVPYDSDTGTAGEDTIGYGHYLTPQEKKDGFVTVAGQAIPFKLGQSQMTDGLAKKLLAQDKEANKPNIKGFDEMPGNVQRGLIDSSFNMGKGFLEKNPTAKAAFGKGDYMGGFLHLMTATNDGGKRSKGLLVRRASAYNMASDGTWPKVNKVHVDEDGGMAVKFQGSTESLPPSIRGIVKDGWLTIKKGKEGSLNSNSTAGDVNI